MISLIDVEQTFGWMMSVLKKFFKKNLKYLWMLAFSTIVFENYYLIFYEINIYLGIWNVFNVFSMFFKNNFYILYFIIIIIIYLKKQVKQLKIIKKYYLKTFFFLLFKNKNYFLFFCCQMYFVVLFWRTKNCFEKQLLNKILFSLS